MIITNMMLIVFEIVMGSFVFAVMCYSQTKYIFTFLDVFDIDSRFLISGLIVGTISALMYNIILVKMGLPIVEMTFGVILGIVATFSWNCLILSKASKKYRAELYKSINKERREERELKTL